MGRPFSNQFPEWAERLVLVVSGGLGKEISPLLKAVTSTYCRYCSTRGSSRQLSGQVPRPDG